MTDYPPKYEFLMVYTIKGFTNELFFSVVKASSTDDAIKVWTREVNDSLTTLVAMSMGSRIDPPPYTEMKRFGALRAVDPVNTPQYKITHRLWKGPNK